MRKSRRTPPRRRPPSPRPPQRRRPRTAAAKARQPKLCRDREARAAAALAARASKPGVKGRGANRPEPESASEIGVFRSLAGQAAPARNRRAQWRPSAETPPTPGNPKPAVSQSGDDGLSAADLKYCEDRSSPNAPHHGRDGTQRSNGIK